MARLVAYLGGQRSGKSALAEKRLARESKVAYLATLRQGGDAEMNNRVRAHRARRPATWPVLPAHSGLVQAARRAKALGCRALLLDGMGLWVAAGMGRGLEPRARATGRAGRAPAADPLEAALRDELRAFMEFSRAHFRLSVLSLDEVGLGGVSPSRAARRFADLNGLINQAACAACDEVHFVMSGMDLKVKG